GEEAVSLLAAGHFFHWIKLCTYELNSGGKKSYSDNICAAGDFALEALLSAETDAFTTVTMPGWRAVTTK
ncbi:MAG: hypothetical protein AB2807_07535, partial [Candidatus Sedimenticola endophacoides]